MLWLPCQARTGPKAPGAPQVGSRPSWLREAVAVACSPYLGFRSQARSSTQRGLEIFRSQSEPCGPRFPLLPCHVRYRGFSSSDIRARCPAITRRTGIFACQMVCKGPRGTCRGWFAAGSLPNSLTATMAVRWAGLALNPGVLRDVPTGMSRVIRTEKGAQRAVVAQLSSGCRPVQGTPPQHGCAGAVRPRAGRTPGNQDVYAVPPPLPAYPGLPVPGAATAAIPLDDQGGPSIATASFGDGRRSICCKGWSSTVMASTILCVACGGALAGAA